MNSVYYRYDLIYSIVLILFINLFYCRSLHTFNMVAIRDVVSGNNLPDVHNRTLEDVAVSEFIPSSEDVQYLKKDMIPLWSRVLVNHIAAFKFLKSVVVYHIPHQYSKEMQKLSEEVKIATFT